LLLLAASTSSTSGDNNNERNDNHNLHWRMLPPPPGLGAASQCMAVPYGIVDSVHCPFGHAIAESGMQSALMANYVNNGKWQERAADNTCHVSMRESTSWHC
jgi:hypothetical protein